MTEAKKRILIVDDDQSIHLATKYILRDRYECFSAYNCDEAKIILQSRPVHCVLLDIHMREKEEGLKYLPQFKELDPDLDIIMVSSNTETDLASRAAKLGASAYLVKEHSVDQLLVTIESVFSKRDLLSENQHYVCDRRRSLEKNTIVGNSPAIKQLMRDIEKIRRSMANVIIMAETGSGKELVARHIGLAEGKPFVAVDSATITHSMAESILFGHEKGAFTGAHSRSKGLFEEANRGTIYFDEISNMPLEIQAKLLRVVQEKEVTRLGSIKTLPLEFRVICATNKDLEKLVLEGKFKEDLLQRLNVITLRIPPLRERKEDIPVLISHFLKKYKCETSPTGFSDEALSELMAYDWPGNVRELSNVVVGLCTMVTDQELIEASDLPPKVRNQALSSRMKSESFSLPNNNFEKPQNATASLIASLVDSQELAKPGMDFYKYMHGIEGKVLTELYKLNDGNISKMSKSLKISRSHLYSKLYAHQLHS